MLWEIHLIASIIVLHSREYTTEIFTKSVPYDRSLTLNAEKESIVLTSGSPPRFTFCLLVGLDNIPIQAPVQTVSREVREALKNEIIRDLENKPLDMRELIFWDIQGLVRASLNLLNSTPITMPFKVA